MNGILSLSQLTPAPVSNVTGFPNAFISLFILAGVIWMYHGYHVSPSVDSSRRFGIFLMGASTLMNLGAAVIGKYWYIAVWSEPLFKLGAGVLVIAALTERNLWGTVYDAWGRLKPTLEEAARSNPARPPDPDIGLHLKPPR